MCFSFQGGGRVGAQHHYIIINTWHNNTTRLNSIDGCVMGWQEWPLCVSASRLEAGWGLRLIDYRND